jgi:hypothetical protein
MATFFKQVSKRETRKFNVFLFSSVGITTVLTLSTISLDSRIDLPKVRYATALDWFLLMSFFYCIATLLEFAGVHYFTKASPYMSVAYGCETWSLTLREEHLPRMFENKYLDIQGSK